MTDTKMLPDLPKDISDAIDAVLRKAGEAERSGNIDAADKYSIESWNMLPEPKLGWNYYSNIIPRDNAIFYRNIKDFNKAFHWLELSRISYRSTKENPEPYIEFLAATIYYESGDLDKAFEIFDWQFKNWKTRPFQGEDKKYLDFYLSRKGK